MKKIIVILLTTLSFVFYLYWDCFANDNAYVFVLKIEGSVTLQDSGEKIREMELLYPGMSLVIEKGASLSLTCAGCTILHLNHKNSPYTVKMSDFKQNQSIMAEMIKHFKAALEHFVRALLGNVSVLLECLVEFRAIHVNAALLADLLGKLHGESVRVVQPERDLSREHRRTALPQSSPFLLAPCNTSTS